MSEPPIEPSPPLTFTAPPKPFVLAPAARLSSPASPNSVVPEETDTPPLAPADAPTAVESPKDPDA
eukprot:scaffold1748_cov258-Pinguiococcus_pyrenoidosus.AAC.25